MKLTVLTENVAGGHCLAEHGLSYLIEHHGEKLLFDTGHSDVFMHNAQLLGIDLQNTIDTVVLSHGHWDHGNGLRYLHDKVLYCHPLVFMKRYRRLDNTYLGLEMTKEEVLRRFELRTSSLPVEVKHNIIFLGEIPRLNAFEAQQTPFLDGDKELDFILDDSALAVKDGDELIVVTGCSHSGICNIVDYAIKVTGLSKVKAVIGGFHLKKDDAVTAQTIAYLKKTGVKHVYPTHCTDLEALTVFVRSFGVKQLKTGITIEL